MIVAVQRVRAPNHLITAPSISTRDVFTLPKLS